jgi:hypothetical protein
MAQAHTESATMIHEEITTQSVEALTGKVVQVQARGRELADKFHSLAEVVQGAHTMPRWLRMSHMSVLGACWAQAYFEEIPIFGG